MTAGRGMLPAPPPPPPKKKEEGAELEAAAAERSSAALVSRLRLPEGERCWWLRGEVWAPPRFPLAPVSSVSLSGTITGGGGGGESGVAMAAAIRCL